jgi:adenylosuccinate lyase
MNSLTKISAIDGRYQKKTFKLQGYFSEFALIKYRIYTEIEYLIALKKISKKNQKLLRRVADINLKDAQTVKNIETKGFAGCPATNHDVKAAEYFIKHKLAKTPLKKLSNWVHFALTSEDINNFAYGLMLSDGLTDVILPELKNILSAVKKIALKHKNSPLIAKTHGQPAVPTTFGKEFAVFYSRLKRQYEQLAETKVSVKLNGASGNYNAHRAALGKINWLKFTKNFINSFNKNRKIKLEPNLITTQIEPHDNLAEICDNLRRINTILIDFTQDIWRYISDGLIIQKPVKGEVGSSTMPQKVNPIDFENAEGNLGIANALFEFFARKLPVSRLQRDLSDSTVFRNIGTSFAHSLTAYKSVLKGLSKIRINTVKAKAELLFHPEIIAEALQTILRRENYPFPYEELKKLTRGKKIYLSDLHLFIDNLKVSAKLKSELKKITPLNYLGCSGEITKLCR